MINKIPPPPLHTIPVTELAGVGPALKAKLAKLAIHSVQDILFHLPYRYQDRTQVTPMHALQVGEYAVVEGVVVRTQIIRARVNILQVDLQDATGCIALKFFHFTQAQQQKFLVSGRLRFFGQVKGYGHDLSLIHPERLDLHTLGNQHMQQSLTPIYTTTEGVNQKTWWQLTEQALVLLKQHAAYLPDLLPHDWIQTFQLPDLAASLTLLHRPPPGTQVDTLLSGEHPAQQRLIAEELLAHHLSLRTLRAQAKKLNTIPLQQPGQLVTELIKQLPFSLTDAQLRVFNQIATDLRQSFPMQRLVQGDVGSGKTIVAALSALIALEQGYQVAFMAPTELLAEQHLTNFKNWLTPFGIEVLSITGKLTVANKQKNAAQLQSGKPLIAVGTHALFQAGIEFSNLILVIIDEQHRFGVDQRLALRDKGLMQTGQVPHQLIMTATPIPRTLAMTAYADLDYSVIDELPKGRQPIETRTISNTKRDNLIQKIAAICKANHQIYWVCPLIEESETLQCQAAESCYTELTKQLTDCRIGLVHGKMKTKEKEAVMSAFKAQTLDILVATTVIEVGVDVPNASYMIIENAERLGLAQLHQLRGRIGRGSKQSFCILLCQSPLSELARARLETMRATQDGFAIAQKDLQLRGPGEMLGTRQTGLMQFRVADLARDHLWIERIQTFCAKELKHDTLPIIQLIERWIGSQEKYMNS